MTADNEVALEIDQIETSALGREKVAVKVVGRWLGRRRPPDARAFLVVESDGRRHRFPAMPEPTRTRLGRLGEWEASFAVPAWVEPRLGGQSSLWVGNTVVPLPSVADGHTIGTAIEDEAPFESEAPAAVAPAPSGGQEAEDDQTIAALRAELQQRAASEAQLRGVLAGTRAELDARLALQEQLESAQADLRTELEQLVALVEDADSRRAEVESRAVVLAAELADLQADADELTSAREELAELRARLARVSVARDAAEGETAGLRAELERLGSELAVAGGLAGTHGGLLEAQALLDEARALSSRLRAHGAAPALD
jgi:hypothetical protein